MQDKRPYREFGLWLKSLRQEFGLTQKELAQRMDYHVSFLQKIEQGRRRPSQNFKNQLAAALRINPNAIPDPGLLTAVSVHIPNLNGRVPDPGPIHPASYLPLSPNPLFTGRQAELQALAQAITHKQAVAVGQHGQATVATGIGGIGKTQLAVEFAHRYGRYFSGGVFWLNFADAEAIPTEIARCGQNDCLDLQPGFAQLPLDKQVRQVQRVWQENIPRLLIFDNCEEEMLFARWRPAHGGCHILITSRRARWDPALGVWHVMLDILERPQSVSLLQGFVPTLTQTPAARIAQELGDLPLALHLAGSYLSLFGDDITPADYLAQLQQATRLSHPSLRHGRFSPTAHENHVARTFEMSVCRLDTANPRDQLAHTLLIYAARFAPGEPIPPQLLQAAAPQTAVNVTQALDRLEALGLITRGKKGIVRVHQLVAEFARLLAADEAVVAQTAVENALISQTAACNASRDLYPAREWQAHLRYVTNLAQTRRDEQTAALCHVLGHHLWLCSNYEAARPYLETAVQLRETILGEEHSDTAAALTLLGQVYRNTEQFKKALDCHGRALTINQQNPHAPPTDLAENHTQLALTLETVGQVKETTQHLYEALAIRRQQLGQEHPDTAFTYLILGFNLRTLGKFDEALRVMEKSLHICKKIHGPVHPDTARSLNGVGLILYRMNRPVESHTHFQQALSIRLQILGSHHNDTIMSFNNVGISLQELGRYDEAVNHFQQALSGWEDLYGPQHHETAITCHNLGKCLRLMGRNLDAYTYSERARRIWEETLGTEHHFTADCYQNLGLLYRDMGERPQAQTYLQQALHVRE
ncbi:MAG: tetratricopeptide repeat protein, partial [Chloroflexi bacterium]|nr:tetratricopeptide repeat protein [Chloroflexota bacterium]